MCVCVCVREREGKVVFVVMSDRSFLQEPILAAGHMLEVHITMEVALLVGKSQVSYSPPSFAKNVPHSCTHEDVFFRDRFAV